MGKDFVISDITTGLGSGVNKYYLIVNPDTTIRSAIQFLVSSITGATFTIFEGAIVSANGTAIAMFNQRRDATFTPQITVYKDPTVTTEGTAIYSERIGSTTTGDKIGSTQTERDELEFSLKSNTNYLVKITTIAVGTDISFSLRWTEFAF